MIDAIACPGRPCRQDRSGRPSANRSQSRGFRGACAALGAALLFGGTAAAARSDTPPVMVLHVDGIVGVATGGYIERGLERAAAANAALVVLRLDTPGGLVSSTRDIVRAILASTVPVAVFVAPHGARAASAGTYLAYAAHVAAMAPGTHLGAATPIALGAPGAPPRPDKDGGKKDGGDGLGTAERKIVNDAAAYLRSLAQLRHRNAEWAERAVRTAATLTAEEALAERVVDLIANDTAELLAKVDGRTVRLAGGERRLATKGAAIVAVAPDWRTRLLSVIGHPDIAYLLTLLGLFGILFEFLHPGAIAPGIVGGISLLFGLGALSVLPIDYAGLALVLLGIALMVGEAFMPGVIALGIGGLAAFVAGSVLLFDPSAMPGIDVRISWPLIAATAAVAGAFLVFVLRFAVKARRRPVVSGREEMVGSRGRVLAWRDTHGTVRVHGETWAARSPAPLRPGEPVRVRALEGLTVVVEPEAPSELAR